MAQYGSGVLPLLQRACDRMCRLLPPGSNALFTPVACPNHEVLSGCVVTTTGLSAHERDAISALMAASGGRWAIITSLLLSLLLFILICHYNILRSCAVLVYLHQIHLTYKIGTENDERKLEMLKGALWTPREMHFLTSLSATTLFYISRSNTKICTRNACQL